MLRDACAVVRCAERELQPPHGAEAGAGAEAEAEAGYGSGAGAGAGAEAGASPQPAAAPVLLAELSKDLDGTSSPQSASWYIQRALLTP